MRNFLAALDTWLITRIFEPVSWWFEATLEINCFSLARYSLTIHLATQCMLQIHHSGVIAGAIDAAISTFIWFIACGACSDIERRTKRSSPYINQLRANWQLRLLGIVFVTLVVVIGPTHAKFLPTEHMLDTLSQGYLLGYLYFASCTPMPPGRRIKERQKKWVYA